LAWVTSTITIVAERRPYEVRNPYSAGRRRRATKSGIGQRSMRSCARCRDAGLIGPLPVLSQDVQLVVVDIHAVAEGYRASKLIGSNVVNDQNEKVGTIEDIIIARDRVLYAVLQVGGFLHLGGRMVAIPYQSLVLDESGKIKL